MSTVAPEMTARMRSMSVATCARPRRSSMLMSRASRTDGRSLSSSRTGGSTLSGTAGQLGALHDLVDELLVGAGDGDQHLVGLVVGHDRGEVGDVAHDGHAEHRAALLAGVVVDDDHRDAVGLAAAAHLAHDRRPGVAGADHGDPRGGPGVGAATPPRRRRRPWKRAAPIIIVARKAPSSATERGTGRARVGLTRKITAPGGRRRRTRCAEPRPRWRASRSARTGPRPGWRRAARG